MNDDELPEALAGSPTEAGDDVLLRVAAVIRGSKRLQAMVPLSAAEREELVDAAMAQVLGSEAGAEEKGAAVLGGKSEAIAIEGKSGGVIEGKSEAAAGVAGVAPVLPLRRRFGVRTAGAVALAAAALAAVLALLLRSAPRAAPPLPLYAMLVAGEQGTRGDPAAPSATPVEVRPSTRLVLTLTPAKAERDALLRLVLVRGGAAALLEVPVRRTAGGAMTIEGVAGELLGAQGDGEVELVAILGRELPDDEVIRALALGRTALPRHLQARRQQLRLVGFSHTSAPAEVLLGGCSAVTIDAAVVGGVGAAAAGTRRCEVAAGAPLRLWIGVAGADQVELLIDGRAVSMRGAASAGGVAFAFEAPATGGALEVRVGGAPVGTWQLAPAASWARLVAFDAAFAGGELEEAAAALDAGGEQAPAEQLEVLRRRARLARARGRPDEAIDRRREAVAMARSLGRLSAEIDETVAIIFNLVDAHQLAAAAAHLEALDALGSRQALGVLYGEGAMHREMARGWLASDRGELGTALRAWRGAHALAERLASRQIDLTRAPLAAVLQSLGRSSEVRELTEAEIRRGEGDGEVCARSDALTSAGWLLRELDRPRALLLVERAARLAAQHCPSRQPITLVNHGWLLADAGRFGAARTALARLSRLSRLGQAEEQRGVTWGLLLEAELLLDEDPAAAERYAERLAARAGELCSSELAYEAQLLRARSQAAQGRAEAAAAAFGEAERELAVWSRMVPLGEGRSTFFPRHDQLALAAIPFFLEQAAKEQPWARPALAGTVRRSLARFAGSLGGGEHERAGDDDRTQLSAQLARALERWPLVGALGHQRALGRNGAAGGAGGTGTGSGTGSGSGTESETADAPNSIGASALSGLCQARQAAARAVAARALDEPPAHASLFVHPDRRGLLLLAWRGSSISFTELPAASADEPPSSLAARIAAAAAPLLAGAPRVHLQLHRSLVALPLDRSLGRALAASPRRPGESPLTSLVAFTVDLPASPAPPAPAARCDGAPRALLVSNPQQNLWAASQSAPIVREQLRQRGFVVDELAGAAVTRGALEARLADPCTALLHYDGHALAALDASSTRASASSAASATLPRSAARDRVDDALLLAGGDTLTAGQILGLSRVPPAIVLNGCTTAAPEGLGLAQAFLAAGATQVIASLEVIAADDAARFTTHLFEGAASSGAALDLVSLFWRALAEADVPSLRTFER